MNIELENFIIISDKEISYINVIIDTLINKTPDILKFFELKKLSNKKKVVIWCDREKYKSHVEKCMGVGKFKEWMCGDTNDENINLLEITEARKSKSHIDMDLDEFITTILHEFVHCCEQELSNNPHGNTWYWEALATNLSGQNMKFINLETCDFERLKNDFNGYAGYNYAYTIGKYMLNNLSQEILIEYLKNPNLLLDDTNKIFKEAKEYSNKKIIGIQIK